MCVGFADRKLDDALLLGLQIDDIRAEHLVVLVDDPACDPELPNFGHGGRPNLDHPLPAGRMDLEERIHALVV